MILADTSAWIEMFEGRDAVLLEQVQKEQVLMHPWVLGELGLGNLPDRKMRLGHLSLMLDAPVIAEKNVMGFIEEHRLFGMGISWVDCQLLASAKAMEVNLWTHDKALKRAWKKVRRA